MHILGIVRVQSFWERMFCSCPIILRKTALCQKFLKNNFSPTLFFLISWKLLKHLSPGKKPYIHHSTILILQLGPIMGQKYHFLKNFKSKDGGGHFLKNAKDGGGHLQWLTCISIAISINTTKTAYLASLRGQICEIHTYWTIYTKILLKMYLEK